jgi:hypothetical protein
MKRGLYYNTVTAGRETNLEQDLLVIRVRLDLLRFEEIRLGANLIGRVQVMLICAQQQGNLVCRSGRV